MKNHEFDNQIFLNFKESMRREIRYSKEKCEGEESVPSFPKEIRIQLTKKCNLRCKHCFQWSNNGYYKNNSSQPDTETNLSFELLQKLILQTASLKPSIYLWGGEPLMYIEWDSLISLLSKDTRQKIISTNGTFIDEKIESLIKISENLDVVFSIDGLMDEHDFLRGKGVFNRVISNIKLLAKEKNAGRFKGRITINCSIHDAMIKNLVKFVNFCRELEINKLIMGFPWFINKQVCAEMDEYYSKYFHWLPSRPDKHTWYNFAYQLDLSNLLNLKEQIDKIRREKYDFKLRFHPDLKYGMKAILTGNAFDQNKKVNCIAPFSRLAVWANGEVSFCGDFPEFCLDNLKNNDIEAIWQGENFNKIRNIIRTTHRPASLCMRCRFSSNNLV